MARQRDGMMDHCDVEIGVRMLRVFIGTLVTMLLIVPLVAMIGSSFASMSKEPFNPVSAAVCEDSECGD